MDTLKDLFITPQRMDIYNVSCGDALGNATWIKLHYKIDLFIKLEKMMEYYVDTQYDFTE